jgi:hypothetical protein
VYIFSEDENKTGKKRDFGGEGIELNDIAI